MHRLCLRSPLIPLQSKFILSISLGKPLIIIIRCNICISFLADNASFNIKCGSLKALPNEHFADG